LSEMWLSPVACLLLAVFSAGSEVHKPPQIGPPSGEFQYIFVKKLTRHNYKEVLSAPGVHSYAVEFYAPWCPHCQHFAPTMEKVGYVFNVPGSPVNVASVDCVSDEEVCTAFNIQGYPMLQYASKEDWRAGFTSKRDDFIAIKAALQAMQQQSNSKEDAAEKIEQQREQEQRQIDTQEQSSYSRPEWMQGLEETQQEERGASPTPPAQLQQQQKHQKKKAQKGKHSSALKVTRVSSSSQQSKQLNFAAVVAAAEEVHAMADKKMAAAATADTATSNAEARLAATIEIDGSASAKSTSAVANEEGEKNDEKYHVTASSGAASFSSSSSFSSAAEAAKQESELDNRIAELQARKAKLQHKHTHRKQQQQQRWFNGWTIAQGGGQASDIIRNINQRANTNFSLPADNGFAANFQVRLLSQSQDKPLMQKLFKQTWSKVNQWDVLTATAMSISFIFASPQLAGEPTVRQEAQSFLHLLCTSFPDQSCRPSLCSLHKMAHANFSAGDVLSWDTVYSNWKVCGKPWSVFEKGWNECKGSFPHARGYTCGLWLLFHSLIANLPLHQNDPKFYSNAVKAVRGFVANFFACVECRDHFLGLSLDYTNVKSHKDAVLFVWDKHNAVNKRVSGIEQEFGDGDPVFVKSLVPAHKQCPDCGGPADGFGPAHWDLGKVYEWLLRYYRNGSVTVN